MKTKKNEMNLEDYFSTTDLALIATLRTFDFFEHSINKDDPRRAVFYFVKTPKLEETINKFWEHQLVVDPLLFFQRVKEIKTKIYG